MAATTFRFETHLPIPEFGTPDYNVITTFMNNMGTLTTCYYYQVYKAPNGVTSYWAFYGYVTQVQQNTALGYLNTLNTTLSTGPVLCVVWQGTTQP